MAREKRACKNHPQILASRQCYYCKEAVCPQCQQTIEHHIFCSRGCYVKWKWGSVYKKIRAFKRWTPLFITLLILANILQYFHFENKIAQWEKKKLPAEQVQGKSEPSFFQLDSARFPLKNILQIKVNAPRGRLISLWRDSLLAASIAADGEEIIFGSQILHSGNNNFALFSMNHLGKSTLLDSFSVYLDSKYIDYLKRPVSRVRTRRKALAFTFDAGWVKEGAPEILDILRRNQIRCTIFLTGEFMRRYPDIVRELTDDGHETGNHSLTHPHLTLLEVDGSSRNREYVNRDFLYGQLLTADSMYTAISGRSMARLWRAPFGELNKDILLWAAEAGYKHIGWSARCDTWDWVTDSASALYRTNREILEHLLEEEEKSGLNGKIILMHFGTERKKDKPYQILNELFEELRRRNYSFVTVTELMALQER